jgi:hypothetical protein
VAGKIHMRLVGRHKQKTYPAFALSEGILCRLQYPRKVKGPVFKQKQNS